MRASRWTREADGIITLPTIGRGQEFVSEADKELREWTSLLIDLSHADESPHTRMTLPR